MTTETETKEAEHGLRVTVRHGTGIDHRYRSRECPRCRNISLRHLVYTEGEGIEWACDCGYLQIYRSEEDE